MGRLVDPGRCVVRERIDRPVLGVVRLCVRPSAEWSGLMEWEVDHHQRGGEWGGVGLGRACCWWRFSCLFPMQILRRANGLPRAGMELKRFSTMQTILNVCPVSHSTAFEQSPVHMHHTFLFSSRYRSLVLIYCLVVPCYIRIEIACASGFAGAASAPSPVSGSNSSCLTIKSLR